MTDQPAVSPEGLSRDELYKNWLAWVTAHMGSDAELAPIAANAAADAAVKGEGFNGAAEAARMAWVDAAPAGKALWRPRFWTLLLTNLYFWALLVFVLATPFVRITAIVVAVLLPLVGWQAYRMWRLSKEGIVVPGSLVDVQTHWVGRRRSYTATYQFEFHGPNFTSHMYTQEDSVRQNVFVLFDPIDTRIAMVMPELLNPGA